MSNAYRTYIAAENTASALRAKMYAMIERVRVMGEDAVSFEVFEAVEADATRATLAARSAWAALKAHQGR